MDRAKRDFIVRRGVLGTGLPVALLMSLTIAFQVPGYLFKMQSFHWKTFVVALAVFVPIFGIAGWFWGLLVCRFFRRKP